MENNTELEEGEAFSYKDDDEDNIYLDSLSYIDERIQHVLGHFQKDFEGGVTAENLGSKYGSYGSFLPTYERSCVESHPKTPQRNHCSPNSPINLHKEVASRRLKAPSIAPPSRLGTSSYSSYLIHNVRTPSVDGSVKKEGMISSSEVADRSTIKDDTTKKSGNSNDQRTLKLRFKMKSNIFAQKNGAIYSGLGLDNSPSSSMGNSPVESEGMATVSKENVNDSPAVIIQVMTSFPIPRGVLTSPLPESMLYLIKKENVIGDCRYMSSANGNQEPSSMYTGESDSLVGDGHLRKKVRIGKLSEKQLELKHMNGVLSENDMTLHSKKKLGNTIPDCKEIISNDLKCMALSSSVFDAGGTTKVTGKASEVSKEVNKGRMEGRMVSVGAVKQESLESISGQGFDKIGKQRAGNGFMKNILENELENPYKDNFRVPKNNDKCNDTSMISEKVECDAVKCKADQNPQKHETNQKKKTLSEGKNKSKVSQSLGKAESVARKDSFGCTNNPKVTDKESADIYVTSGRSKMNKTKSLKDNKVRDSNRDSLKEKKSEWKVDGPPGNIAIKNGNIDNFVKQSAFGAKIKKRPSVNKVDDQLLAEPCTKDASGSFPIVENELVPEMITSAVAAPQLIAEDWVCCDSCEKWRLLPTGIKTEQLPEKWLCSMQNWLSGMNLCDISEEETTNALYASYQIPISEGKNNIQSHAAGLASGVSSDAVQIGLNQEKSNSNVLSIRGKKRHAIKEKTMLEFNNRMINAQESGKIISLTDMNQHPEDSNPMKHMTSKHFSMYNKLIEERHVAKDIQKQINGGDKKLIKLKRKMDTDQYRSGTPKKSKTEDVCYAKKLLKPSMSIDKVGLKSRNGQPAKASGMDMQKYDNYCLPEDVEDKLLDPVKKDGDQSLSDDGSFDVKHGSKNDVSVKKRKFKDWVDNEKHDDSFSLQGDKQCGKEGNASGFRKEKKSRILNTEAKSVMEADDKLNKGGMTHACLSGCRGQMDVGTKVKFVDKAQQPKKHRVNTASHKSSDGIGQLGKDFGSGQLSLAPTSSSSKVLGSNRAKANLEDVIGSPVESVTSSSLRTSKLNKHILAVGGISGRDDASKGGLSSIGSRRSADNTEGMLSVKLKDRISHNLHPACHNVSIIEYRVEDVKDKARVRAKTSEVKNDHLFEGGVPVEQCGSCTNAMHHEEKVDKNNQESKLSWQKSGNVTSLHGKEKDWMSGSKVGKDKMKLSALENDYSKNGGRHGSTVDPSYHAYVPETKNNAKCSSPKSKHEIDNISQKNALRHGSSETGKKTKVKQKDLESSVLKMDAQCRTDRWNISQQNLIQGSEDENEANYVYPESRDGKSLVLTSSVSEVKSEALYVGSRTEPGFQKGGMNNELPVHVSGNGDVAKTMIKSVDLSSNVGVNYNPEKVPDQHLIVSSPMQTKSSQTASNMLEEATKLKDRADHYKSSGFEFESNETYFDAALKFLHGASLVENCHNESRKHEDMNQTQLYATAANLFKSCAHEYERHQEMAAAALSYKCMEVAYMRVVYCKHPSTNMDRHELQTTLQMVSQGESSSSSASDIDNLNNQTAVYKATFPVATNNLVSGNQVISAQTRPNLVRLLDFTQDINFAMEASGKCQSAFAAANVNMEEARHKDCIKSIRRVIDFSFQDADELVHLVLMATNAIRLAGLGSARD